MGRAILRFILCSIKPLSKNADVWDIKDIVQAIIIVGGLGGGGGRALTVNTDVAIWVLAGIPALLFLFAGIKLQLKVARYEERPVPRLVFGEGEVNPFRTLAGGGPTPETEDPRTRGAREIESYGGKVMIPVSNDPTNHPPEAEAKDAVINLKFYKFNNDTPILSIDGRWSDNPQESTIGKHASLAQLRPRNLLPNGDSHHIDIVRKYRDDKDWYATNDIAMRGAKGGVYPDYRLPLEPLRVRVAINAVNMPAEVQSWWKIENLGKGNFVKIEPLSD